MSMSMVERSLRLGTQPVLPATVIAAYDLMVAGEQHTGTAWSVGNSPLDDLRLCSTILDAGNTKSSTSS